MVLSQKYPRVLKGMLKKRCYLHTATNATTATKTIATYNY